MDLDISTLARLLQLRVSFSGAGAFQTNLRSTDHEENNAAACIGMIGNGTHAIARRRSDGTEVARMHHPSGDPFGRVLDISKPENFAILMHNMDYALWENTEPRMENPPYEMAPFIDLAVTSKESSVIDAVEVVFAQGRMLEPASDWMMSDDARKLIEVCAVSENPQLAMAAKDFSAVLAGEKPSVEFNAATSLHRWLYLANSTDAPKPEPNWLP